MEKLRPTNYFTYDELAVILVAMNMSVESICRLRGSDCSRGTDNSLQRVFSKFPYFECPVGSNGKGEKTSKAYRNNVNTSLEPSYMEYFAFAFKQALSMLNTLDYTFNDIRRYLGMNFDYSQIGGHLANADIDMVNFKNFVAKFVDNYYLTFSLAGCKSFFHGRQGNDFKILNQPITK